MTAIFLAAMIFIVEAVQRREGLDDPLYELFLSKSWTRWIFATAVWLLFGTALLYLLGPITGGFGDLLHARGDVLGISSLIVAALLVLVFLLRALHVLRPAQYRAFRREAVLDQVRYGAQSRVRTPRSTAGSLRELRGILSDSETQATRAIERVVDQTYQAVAQAQLSDVREGMALLEEICMTVLAELEKSDDEEQEISSRADRRWLGHDNILAGLQRLVRTAATTDAHESVLRAIFHADVKRTRTFMAVPYRLSDNVEADNELFVQVMLECVGLEKQAVDRLTHEPLALSFEGPHTEMLSDALSSALSRTKVAPADTRKSRIARRMVAFVHESAAESALKQDVNQASALLKCLLRHADEALSTNHQSRAFDEALHSLLRYAILSGIGYGVGARSDELVDTANGNSGVRGLVGSGLSRDVFLNIMQDANQGYGGESILSGGLFSLSAGLRPRRSPIETESDFQEAKAECVVLGYMWLLGMIHHNDGEVSLAGEARVEFDRVWRVYGRHLVAALDRAGIGVGRDLWKWGEASFALPVKDVE